MSTIEIVLYECIGGLAVVLSYVLYTRVKARIRKLKYRKLESLKR